METHTHMTPPEYPQLNRIAQITAGNGFTWLNGFLTWLEEQNFVICETCEGQTTIEVDPVDIARAFEVAVFEGLFVPTRATRQDILTNFFNLDLEEANKELKALCENAKRKG